MRELSTIADLELLLLVSPKQKEHLPVELRALAIEVGINRTRSYWQLLSQLSIAKLLRREQIDVYHVPNTLPLLCRTVPTVVTIHDLCELRVQKYSIARTLYRRVLNCTAAHVADRVITVSQNSKNDIVTLLRIPEEKVTVIHNGVGPEFHSLDKRECASFVQARFGVVGHFLLATGGFSGNKNLYGMLCTLVNVRAAGFDVSLVLTGAASESTFADVRSRASAMGVGSNVIITGHVSPSELPKFYSASSLVLYPSRYEGFGLPVLEAMACATPIIASNRSSIPEIAADAAILIDPDNVQEMTEAVIQVLSEQSLRERMIVRGLKRASKFKWETTATDTLDVYRAVAKRSLPPEI